MLGISESWLKSYITDAQIHIKDYVPIRSDRSIRKGGGAILYIHEKIPISDEDRDHFDDITCQASLCILQTISTILINVYRPPKSFSNLLKHVQSYLDKHINDKHYDINILGDFNFPNIDWSSSICNPSHGREQQLAGEALLSFIDYNMLYQVVNTPTRDRNILELFLTNNERLIRNVSAQDTPLSDHRVVSINLLTNLKSQSPPSPIPTFEDHTFRSLNIHKADFIKMNSMLSAIDWDLLRDQCHSDPDGSLFVKLFRLIVLQVCCICSPKKLSDQKSVAPKSEHFIKIYVLNRKRRKLNSQLKALKDRNPLSPKIKKIEEEINLIHFNIKEAHCAEQNH